MEWFTGSITDSKSWPGRTGWFDWFSFFVGLEQLLGADQPQQREISQTHLELDI